MNNKQGPTIEQHMGKQLKKLRMKAQLPPETVGDFIGLNAREVIDIEGGFKTLTASELYGLSRAFNIDLEYFFEFLPGDYDIGT